MSAYKEVIKELPLTLMEHAFVPFHQASEQTALINSFSFLSNDSCAERHQRKFGDFKTLQSKRDSDNCTA